MESIPTRDLQRRDHAVLATQLLLGPSPLAAERVDPRYLIYDVARGVGSRPILIPTDDESCLFVADHAETLRDAFLMPEQPVGLARSLSNKQTLNDICALCAIPTPKTLFPKSRSDVEGFIDDLIFPVMLKGIDTKALRRRTGVSMVAVHDAGELLRSYDRLESPDNPSLMLQEYIPGGSEMVWMFNGYFDHESDCLFGVTGKKLRQYPPHTGVTSLGMCVTNRAESQNGLPVSWQPSDIAASSTSDTSSTVAPPVQAAGRQSPHRHDVSALRRFSRHGCRPRSLPRPDRTTGPIGASRRGS
jgi:hypothetical protein